MLPAQDWNVYWRYRISDDFTQFVDEFKTSTDEDTGEEKRSETLGDLCGFWLAATSRLNIQGHFATKIGRAHV